MIFSSEMSVWRQRKKMKGRPWDEKAPNDQRFLWIERSAPKPKAFLCCLCHCCPGVDFKNFFKCSSGMQGHTSGSREKLSRPWGRLKFWMIPTFFWIVSFLHHQIPLGQCGTGYIWSKASSGLSILPTLLTQPAASAAFVPWPFTLSALTRSRCCPWCSCLCPLPTHSDRTHIKEGQSSSPSADGREGKWITHFTHARHVQQGSDMAIANCQEALVRNVLMWEQSGEIKHLGKERSEYPKKSTKQTIGRERGKTDAVHHPLMNSSQSESEFCPKEKTMNEERDKESKERHQETNHLLFVKIIGKKMNQPPAYSRQLPWSQDHRQTTTVCLWQQLLKGFPENKEKAMVLQSRG